MGLAYTLSASSAAANGKFEKVNFYSFAYHNKTFSAPNLPGSLTKDFKARVAKILSSILFDDWRTFMNSSSKALQAPLFTPVSGSIESMCVSHVAMTRHDFAISNELLLRHSSKALKIDPFSWLQSTKATLFCQEVTAFSSSSCLGALKDQGFRIHSKL